MEQPHEELDQPETAVDEEGEENVEDAERIADLPFEDRDDTPNV